VLPEVAHQSGRGRSGHLQLAEQDGDCAGGRGDVRCRSGAADPAVASRYVPGVDGLDVDRAAETPALALQAAGVTSALARPRSWAGAASRWSAPEPALAVNRMACRRSLRDRNRGRPALASSACRRRRRRCSGTRRSGPPGPAGILRQISASGQARSGVAVAAVSRAGRCAPPRSSASTSIAATAPPDRPTPPPSPPARKAGALAPGQVAGASVPVSRARISPTVRSRPSGSGSGRCAWTW